MIAFAGLTHLGIVYSAATAAKGFSVIGFDTQERVQPLAQGRLPILEPGLDGLFLAHRARLNFRSDPGALREAVVVFLSLDVATDAQNRADFQPLRNALAQVLPELRQGTVVVILSQVGPGFTRALAADFPALASGRLELFYQVETLVFGDAVRRALAPERFIVGCADPKRPFPQAYSDWLKSFGCPILPMRYESAELTKIAINLFLISSVTTTNALGELCEKIGADWQEIAPALKLDRRIGPHAYLQPGLGLSGGNLERDLAAVQALARQFGTEAQLFRAWQEDGPYRLDWVIRKIHQLAWTSAAEPRLAIWGLAYKAQTHSTKNSPALAVIKALGNLPHQAFDPAISGPLADAPACRTAASALEACRAADLLVVMTPWPDFGEIPPDDVKSVMRGRVVIDPYGALASTEYKRLGFSYHRLGTPGAATPP